MEYKSPSQCPVCGDELSITRLSCGNCKTSLEGNFASCKYCKLADEQIEFLEVFIGCRGNIKEVERELGISYPTVRNRLEGLIEALDCKVEKNPILDEEEEARRQSILTDLGKGEIDYREAAKRLRRPL
jgi:hypothetical protein